MNSIELFAGIGGISLAAEWAGIETKAFCEIDPFAQKVLKKHWPDVPIFEDVRKLNKQTLQERGVDVGTIDIISGGFPCQPYSIAGKRKGSTDDRALWGEMFRIIEEIRPTWVVGENVANFVNMELDKTLFDLESIGYRGKSFIIPASAVNAPHRRYRVFIVAQLSNSSSIGYKRDEQLSKDSGTIKKRRKSLHGSTTELFDDVNWKERAIESGIHRGNNGIPNRLDRIRGLGNAVVPQQIYPIFQAIKQIHDMEVIS
ncbi:DNA cytosine methyltransferase [Gracilibacillus saliphilus]|uniref:DNA cytosine methyltransferase n=1 Tax=Gracilibacillus saliphilus TaxID=543890 RepID=UPI0013D423DA|nr:DNA (cytosine-5-)-methyltransferase [Gracilibacillus saliphilus]